MEKVTVIEFVKAKTFDGQDFFKFIFSNGTFGTINTVYGNNLSLRGVNNGLITKGKNYQAAQAAANEFLATQGA